MRTTAWFILIGCLMLGLRQTELRLSGAPQDRQGLLQAEDTHAVSAAKPHASEIPLTVSAESRVFEEHLERLSELTLALFLLLVARPASVMLGLLASGTSVRLRGLAAWFGARGIGSLYYLSYAIAHGLPRPLARELADITVVVIIISIVAHGLTVTPLLERYWRK